MDRKQLSELAIHDEVAFNTLVEKAKEANTAPAA
jgi:ribosomal protein L20